MGISREFDRSCMYLLILCVFLIVIVLLINSLQILVNSRKFLMQSESSILNSPHFGHRNASRSFSSSACAQDTATLMFKRLDKISPQQINKPVVLGAARLFDLWTSQSYDEFLRFGLCEYCEMISEMLGKIANDSNGGNNNVANDPDSSTLKTVSWEAFPSAGGSTLNFKISEAIQNTLQNEHIQISYTMYFCIMNVIV
jgi:hypothetical protein